VALSRALTPSIGDILARVDDGGTLDRIEELIDEEHRLLRGHVGEGLDPARHARFEAVQAELDSCWDLLRRRRAGQAERLADAVVPDPPNDLDGPEPEPLHLEHGVHGDQPAPA
jgi:hypothetical protein